MLTRIKKALQNFTAPTGMPDSLNPFSLIMDERTELMPRIYRSTFWQRMSDTYEVLLGKHFQTASKLSNLVVVNSNVRKQHHTSKGLIDVLIFSLLIRKFNALLSKLSQKAFFLAPLVLLINLTTQLPRVLFAGVLTLAASPFVGIAHFFFKYKARQIKKDLATLAIISFKEKTKNEIEEKSLLISKLDAKPESAHYLFPTDTCSIMPIFVSKTADRTYCIDKKNIDIISYPEQDESIRDTYHLALMSELRRDKDTYQLAIMSERHGTTDADDVEHVTLIRVQGYAKPGTIYLSFDSTQPHYVVRDLNGIVRMSSLPKDLPNRQLDSPELKKSILKITSKAGFTPHVMRKYAVQDEAPKLRDDLLLTNWLLLRFTSPELPHTHNFEGLIPVTPENKRGIEALFKLNVGSILGHLATGAERGSRLNIYRQFINNEKVMDDALAVLEKGKKEAQIMLVAAGVSSALKLNPHNDILKLITHLAAGPFEDKDKTSFSTDSNAGISLATEKQNHAPASRRPSITSRLFSLRPSIVGLDVEDERKQDNTEQRRFTLN